MFSFAWSPQTHKLTGGYYLNHDNLMLANEEDRKKLIFYFIASQTPEKLNTEDRALFFEDSLKLKVVPTIYGAFAGTSAAVIAPYYGTRFKRRFFLNSAIRAGIFVFASVVAWNVALAIQEPRYVQSSKLIENLAEKYKFRVYDFGQAKKESRLKELRNELTSESQQILY